MPLASTWLIAGSPSTVAGILTNRFGRSTASQSRCAISTVAPVSRASPGSTSIETRPSTPSVASNTGRRTSQPRRTSSVVISKIASPTLAPRSASAWTWSEYRSPSDSALAKIVGFVVTPTTCLSFTSRSRSPDSISSRDRSSSQMETPAALSAASLSSGWPSVGHLLGGALAHVVSSFAGVLLLRDGDGDVGAVSVWSPVPPSVGSRTPGGGVALGRRHRVPGRGHHRLGREAELAEQRPGVGGGAEVLDGDAAAGVADQLAPAHRDPRLDGDAGADRRRQDGVAVRVVLDVEPLAARHRDHAGGDPVGLQRLARLQRERDLGPGGDQDDVRCAACGLGQHVTALRDARRPRRGCRRWRRRRRGRGWAGSAG